MGMKGKEKVAYWLDYCLNNQHCSDCDSCCYGGRSSMICDSLIKEAIQELSQENKPKTLVKRSHKNPLGDYTRIHCPWCERELHEVNPLRDFKVCPFCANPIQYTNDSMVVS